MHMPLLRPDRSPFVSWPALSAAGPANEALLSSLALAAILLALFA